MKQFFCSLFLAAIPAGLLFSAPAADEPKRIILIAGHKSHGPGEHEYEKGVRLFKHCLDNAPNARGIKCDVFREGWPDDEGALAGAATILFYCDGSDRDEQAHPLLHDDRLERMDRLMKRGTGFVAIHYTVFVPKEKAGAHFLDWAGGYFDYESGPGPNHWFSKIQNRVFHVLPASPDHPISRGVGAFDLKEEFYFNMRFGERGANWFPILKFAEGAPDPEAVVAWAIERTDGGRGFGYTGGHYHENWRNENVRRLVLNALLWTAHVEVPAGGVDSTMPVER